jgi:hypothetical protein
MKSFISLLVLVVLIFIFSFQKKTAPKVYTVSHTQKDWQHELDTLRMFQNAIGYQLSRQESDQWQLVCARMQQRIIAQVSSQLQAEAAKEAAEKKDSTKHK